MRRIATTTAALALLATGSVGIWVWKAGSESKARDAGDASPANAPAPQIVIKDPMTPAFAALGKKPAVDDARRTLQELRASLMDLPKAEAVARIRGFLDRREDHVTGLSFEIAKGGSLAEWPTFRTFLLDVLLSIDPAAAAEVSRALVATPTTADEWALALRNVARGEANLDRDFLRTKSEQLIANPAWQAAPSIGYLNAFDVLVHVEATASTPLLSGLVQQKDRKDLAHAGFLTLDRLVQAQPVEMLERLAADIPLQQARPEMTAQQFARADLRHPDQRDLVKRWMLDPGRSVVELRAFAGVFPNNNQFVSNNLLTSEAATTGEELADHDREALKVLTAWSSEPAFGPIKEHLRTMISRLEGSVRDGIPPPPN